MILALIAMLALTRAEIVQRMRAPVVTQADGLVKVYASCDEDVRRTYQTPVARAAADVVQELYGAIKKKSVRFAEPGIIVFVCNDRTNTPEVVTRVSTNGTRVVSRIYLRSPGYSDVNRFRIELTRGFYRAVQRRELSEAEAVKALRAADPRLRIADERARLEAWLLGSPAPDGTPMPLAEDEFFAATEEYLQLARKVIEPGVASRRDILTFASRLCLYPRTFDEKFLGGADVLTFREAIALAPLDPRVRFLALQKMSVLPVFGGGRGESLADATYSYVAFLRELAAGRKTREELEKILEMADLKLRAALAQAE